MKKELPPVHSFLHADRLPFGRSKEEAWRAVNARIDATAIIPISPRASREWLKWAVAAAVVAAVAMTSWIYTGQTSVGNDTALAVTLPLPDGSLASLDGGAHVHYNQHTWFVSRKIALSGNAFFEVEKGAPFEVNTPHGKVKVLGTSFNVNSGPSSIEVSCKTGKVAVNLIGGKAYELTQGKAVYSDTREVKQFEIDPSAIATWTTAIYTFNDVFVKDVLDKLAADNGFTLDIQTGLSARYTGQFSKKENLENIFDIVCKPVGLAFDIDHEQKLITIKNK